jgi:protein-S-isoprenylcysteine O-methyltransferase Ste14
MAEDKAKAKKHFELIRRGEKKPTLSGTLTFIGLRLADIPLQSALLSPSPSGLGVRALSALGLRTIFTHTSTATLPLSLFLPVASLAPSAATSLGWLANLTPTGLILLLMSAGSAAKQIYWQTSLSQESFPASAAAAVSGYNTVVNSANSLLFLALATTSLLSRPQVSFSLSSVATPHLTLPLSTMIGTLLYVIGMAVETQSERQRAAFKAHPENEGKVCKVGLWRWARHVNYFGYALWRGGYCMVSTGWIGGFVMGLWQGYVLSSRAVVIMDEYCSNKYKEQWVQFKQDVPYRIIPGIY